MKQRSQQGAAAVECALLMTLVLMLALVPAYFGKTLMTYNVMRKAAGSAAMLVAQATAVEFRDASSVDKLNSQAQKLITRDFSASRLANDGSGAFISCDGHSCTGSLNPPATVKLMAGWNVTSPQLVEIVPGLVGIDTALGVDASVQAPYVY